MRNISGRLLAFMAVALLCAACTAAPRVSLSGGNAAADAAASPEHMIGYNCDDGRTIDVRLLGAERAQLKINGAMAELRAVRTASGAKFESADGGIVFWSKGNEATVETRAADGRHVRMLCGMNPAG